MVYISGFRMSSIEEKKHEILRLVGEYISEKHSNKKWRRGEDWVRYSGPVFDSEEYIKAVDSLLGEWLVLGKDAIGFENKFPKYLGKNFGVLTNSGSSANLVMMSAMKSKKLFNFPEGTKVITPVAGFPTTVNPILQNGFQPVFVDIEIDTLNLNIEQVEKNAKSGAKIITFAHVLGNPPNMDKLMEVVKEYNLILLEDCCDALGSSYNSQPLGSFGEMATCSFYPAHHISMGEGGFVATKDCIQERVVRSFREWGRGCYCIGEKANLLKDGTCKKRFSNWLPAMEDKVFDHKYVYEEIGYNLKPIELQASMGLAQLDKFQEIHNKRIENHSKLFKVFEQYEEFFHLPRATDKSEPSWFAFALSLRDGCPFSRDEITNFLESNKIQTRTYFAGNLLLQPAYSHLSDIKDSMRNFPVSTKVTTDTFFLGTSPVITSEQIEYIEETVKEFINSKI